MTCEKCKHDEPHVGKADGKEGLCLVKDCGCNEQTREIPRSLKFRWAHWNTQRRLRRQHTTVDDRVEKIKGSPKSPPPLTDDALAPTMAAALDEANEAVEALFEDMKKNPAAGQWSTSYKKTIVTNSGDFLDEFLSDLKKLEEPDTPEPSKAELKQALKDLEAWTSDGK